MDAPTVIADAPTRVRQRTASLAACWGRRPRILLTPLQRGALFPVKALAVQLADLGFDVDLFTAPQQAVEAARMAVENDVHAIGVPATVDGPAQLKTALTALGDSDILIVAWAAKGSSADPANAVLQVEAGPESKTAEAALRILDRLHP